MKNLLVVLAVIGVVIGVLGLEFLILGGLVWIVTWAFGLTFSWKIMIGVWAIVAILQMALRAASPSKNDKK